MNLKAEHVLKAGSRKRRVLMDLWTHRELLMVLTRRNISVHYKQATIGILWALIRPLLMFVIYTLVFGVVAKLPSVGDVPYSLLVLSGLLVWFFVATGLSAAAQSFISDAPLVSKVYLPRAVIPVSQILSTLVDFIITFVILLAAMAWHGITPGASVIFLPLLILHLVVLVVAVGLLFASLTVSYMDVQHAIPFLLQFGLYASPVVYASAIVSEQWQWLYFLNPVAGIIETLRACLFDQPIPFAGWLQSVIITILLLCVAVHYFVTVERTMADKL